jgi:membrane protein implicated in regulation of membrane protease activity
MRLQRRTAPLIGLVSLVLAGMYLVQSIGALPGGLLDLLARGLPALLVLGGLALLLRDRLPLSGLIALFISLLLVAGIAYYAFSQRAQQQRSDNVQVIEQTLPTEITLLRLRVQALETEVELLRALDTQPRVSGEFIGSSDNTMDVAYEVLPDESVTLTIAETRAGGFPFLETVGRGALQLELPPNVPMDVEFVSEQGDIILNLSGTELERLNVTARGGDVIVTLPEYQPQFSSDLNALGTIEAQNGDLTVRVPEDVAGRFELNRGGSGIAPQFNEQVYNYLQGDVLEARLIDIADTAVRYTLVAPRGLIRLDVPEASS